MPFKIKPALALKVCTDQVEGIIVAPKFRYTEWTDESLFKFLQDLGMDYTLEEIQLINEELHNRGVVQDA